LFVEDAGQLVMHNGLELMNAWSNCISFCIRNR